MLLLMEKRPKKELTAYIYLVSKLRTCNMLLLMEKRPKKELTAYIYLVPKLRTCNMLLPLFVETCE